MSMFVWLCVSACVRVFVPACVRASVHICCVLVGWAVHVENARLVPKEKGFLDCSVGATDLLLIVSDCRLIVLNTA